MSDITETINAAITEHLPAQVGEALQSRLKEATEAENRANEFAKRLDYVAASLDTLSTQHAALVDRTADIEKREKELLDAEAKLAARTLDLAVRERTVELIETHAKDRVADNMAVVKAVFGNNKYKYDRTTHGHVALPGMDPTHDVKDAHGCIQSYGSQGVEPRAEPVTDHETIEGEGEVPR